MRPDGVARGGAPHPPDAPGSERRSFGDPRVLVPFAIVTLIWGSTWIVIRDQLGEVPPSWSVTYRFLIAGGAMFILASATGAGTRLDRQGHLLAAAFGLLQFTLNFNFVYAAELYITSGLVALSFALLLVPNSLFAWLFLGQKVSRRFVAGSVVAILGVALLFVEEFRTMRVEPGQVALGLALTVAAILCASLSNIVQTARRMARHPIMTIIAWAMLYGTLANALGAFFWYGPPVVENRIGYWAGLLYLAIFGSAVTFTLFFRILRAVGAARAAYVALLIPIIAMLLSTLFEDYAWSALALAGVLLALSGLAIALREKEAAPSAHPAMPAAAGDPASGTDAAAPATAVRKDH